MFFQLHDERKIGYKLLSESDLGIGTGRSHQTHIGLSEGVLTFLSDKNIICEDSIFIYGDSFDYIDAYFDRIGNPDETFRSPKIKMGGIGTVSITSTIREKVKKSNKNLKWYLFWFGLKNDKIVFLLLNNKSDDYHAIINLGLDLNDIKSGAKVLQGRDINIIANFIEYRLNENGVETLRELEVATQSGIIQPSKCFGAYDIERANAYFKAIGAKGEALINKYLDTRFQCKEIQKFTWYNQSRESGRPYDFTFQTLNGNIVYLDVKTTKFGFNQKMVFSNQEIDFITTTTDEYNIFRVYYEVDDSPYLRICNNCKDIATRIHMHTEDYKTNLTNVQSKLQNAKLVISPENALLKFATEISLG